MEEVFKLELEQKHYIFGRDSALKKILATSSKAELLAAQYCLKNYHTFPQLIYNFPSIYLPHHFS